MLNIVVLFSFVVIIGAASMSTALKPPKEFFLCHRSDPDFGKCLGRAVQNSILAIAAGNKNLGVPVLDHLNVASINIEGNHSPVDLSQHYTDCVISGATNAIFTYAEAAFEKDKCFINLKTYTDTLSMTCQYAFKGKLLLFQLNGHGHSNTTLINMNSWHNLTCNIYEKGGTEYLNITDWREEYGAGNIYYDFDNLVDGNAEMSAQILQVINNNAMEVLEHVKVDYQNSYAAIYKALANNVFSKIPWKDIFLE